MQLADDHDMHFHFHLQAEEVEIKQQNLLPNAPKTTRVLDEIIFFFTTKKGCSFACPSNLAMTSEGTSWTCLAKFSKTRLTFSHDWHQGAWT